MRLGWRISRIDFGQVGGERPTRSRINQHSVKHRRRYGKFSARDRARFFEMARGSALECAACLDVLIVRKLAKEEPLVAQKERLVRIVEMLVGLLRRFSDRADVLREEAPDYLSETEHDYDYEHEHEQEGKG